MPSLPDARDERKTEEYRETPGKKRILPPSNSLADVQEAVVAMLAVAAHLQKL